MFKIKKIYTKQDFAKEFLKDQNEYLTNQYLKNGHCFTNTKDPYTHIIFDEEDMMYKVGKKFLEDNNLIEENDE